MNLNKLKVWLKIRYATMHFTRDSVKFIDFQVMILFCFFQCELCITKQKNQKNLFEKLLLSKKEKLRKKL